MRYRKYHWLYISKSGKLESGNRDFKNVTGLVGQDEALDELTALQLINKWNASSDRWKYWV